MKGPHGWEMPSKYGNLPPWRIQEVQVSIFSLQTLLLLLSSMECQVDVAGENQKVPVLCTRSHSKQVNISGLKSDSRIFPRPNRSFYEECLSLFSPFPQVFRQSPRRRNLWALLFPWHIHLWPTDHSGGCLEPQEQQPPLSLPQALTPSQPWKAPPQTGSGFPLAAPAAKIKPGWSLYPPGLTAGAACSLRQRCEEPISYVPFCSSGCHVSALQVNCSRYPVPLPRSSSQAGCLPLPSCWTQSCLPLM